MKIKSTQQLKEVILKELKSFTSCAIVTHHNPDGDGLPASLALQHILKQFDLSAEVILEEPAPLSYDFLAANDKIKVVQNSMQFDCLILVDCHEKKRIGTCGFLVDSVKQIITIDHHPPGEIIPSSLNYFDVNMVSAGAILYDTFNAEIRDFSEAIQHYLAICFYTTILNDTDHFMNANVDSFTFQMCSELMQYNLNPGEITTQFLYRKKASEMRFVGEVLATIETRENETVLFMDSTLEMLSRNELDHAATSKLTRWVKGTEKIKVIVYFREVASNKYRMSLRSNFINVNKIAVLYDGGGHEKASGCEMKGSLSEVKSVILQHIKEQLA